ncbi:MAG: precorrin-2 C(20)-methyltransferase [Vreelandella alkaliphila]|uniref:Precorrin-2 C(20)-methyltransferase n=1 Tax=Vreelandella alkaliphila TaxID=272774 RepID=A0ABX4HFW9_9GAMM|nr:MULTISPECIES: precorrin-2 C(20)-methyltransferase [Halomonas]MCD6006111.1 precorrin-2 C(20)-methyltransferase [Halomonas sp. IOP_6]PAU71187.1 precorrin-2 C(20)-methyltransferase [Halomonas humidisoli]UTA81206.1 precorrin-2 C(20)-methyltransferase [Halomonas sp. XH26]HBP40447.1 precorrin-2 C(20)-methyltransferase [Halomonas sp.]
MTQGTIYGVGLGPGSQDLMSVRADRLIRGASHVAYFRKQGRSGHARTIVEGLIAPGATELPMEYPVTTEIPFDDPRYNELLSAFYERSVAQLIEMAEAGCDVVVLCEGDPFFYGSFMHLYTRLLNRVPVSVVPGITGMSAAWTATAQPITWGDDIMTVLMATLPEETLAERIAQTDALVVMKIGRNLAKLRRALTHAGREGEAWLIEYAAMTQQRVLPLSEVGESVPYFSIVLIHGNGRRP